jgi:lycopene beta-cyclase
VQRLQLGWQKFVGRVYHFADGHRVVRPVIMDARVEQIDGYRFLYFLPLSANELLIEDTYYSSTSLLDRSALHERLEEAARQLGAGSFSLISEEAGVLPIVMGGSLNDLWPRADSIPRLGLHGGFFNPTTSYSLPDALANAALLADQRDFSANAIFVLLRGKAEKLWRQRRLFQLLNRMLFRAAEPGDRYRILEHFYRLQPAVIARFYAASLTPLDKFKILSGKPPVPIGRALSAMRRGAA